MEIYRKSETILKVICWSYKIYSQLKKEGVIFNEWETDEKLYSFETDNPILPHLFATGSHSRRIFKNGRWLNNKEKRLGHRIYPFNPKID
jgi:hypothetical protein